MLAFESHLDGYPAKPVLHWGGALHGFIECAALHHAKHLLPLIRPNGFDGYSSMAIEVPPFAQMSSPQLRFGVVLFRNAALTWAQLLRAMVKQSSSGLHGVAIQLLTAYLVDPTKPTMELMRDGRVKDLLPQSESEGAWVRRLNWSTAVDASEPQLHRLIFRSPLLLGGRDKIRREQNVPWPTLKSILDSLSKRILALEPELARRIGINSDWTVPEGLEVIRPLTPPEDPAHQVNWSYAPRRGIVKPGIVGTLIYPAALDATCTSLLQWGQWLGVGQQTTMGCGRYVWQAIPISVSE